MDYLKALQDRTRPDLWALITRLADLAANRASPLYIVGGRVRDLLLGSPGIDMDLVVEGDALELVRALALDQGGEAVVHPRFGTATYRNGTLRFDLATARTETYSDPASYPISARAPSKRIWRVGTSPSTQWPCASAPPMRERSWTGSEVGRAWKTA